MALSILLVFSTYTAKKWGSAPEIRLCNCHEVWLWAAVLLTTCHNTHCLRASDVMMTCSQSILCRCQMRIGRGYQPGSGKPVWYVYYFRSSYWIDSHFYAVKRLKSWGFERLLDFGANWFGNHKHIKRLENKKYIYARRHKTAKKLAFL